MSYPRVSISEASTQPATYEEDLAAYKAGGADGIGIWEFKLPDGGDGRSIDALRASLASRTSQRFMHEQKCHRVLNRGRTDKRPLADEHMGGNECLIPRFSISEVTTYPAIFERDLAATRL